MWPVMYVVMLCCGLMGQIYPYPLGFHHWHWDNCTISPVLIHWGRVKHICLSKLTVIGSDNGLAPSHHLNQCWNIVNWTLMNNIQWNINRNSLIFVHKKYCVENAGHFCQYNQSKRYPCAYIFHGIYCSVDCDSGLILGLHPAIERCR